MPKCYSPAHEEANLAFDGASRQGNEPDSPTRLERRLHHCTNL